MSRHQDFEFNLDAAARAEKYERDLKALAALPRHQRRVETQISRLGLLLRVAITTVAISAIAATLLPVVQPINPYHPIYDIDTKTLIGWCGGSVPPKDVLEDRGEDDEDRPDITWYPTCPKE